MKSISYFVALVIIITIIPQSTAHSTEAQSIQLTLEDNPAEDVTRVDLLNDAARECAATDTGRALAYSREALELSSRLDYKEGIARSLRSLGSGHVKTCEFEEALAYFEKAKRAYQELRLVPSIADCLNDIGIVYYYRSNYSAAIDYFQRAVEKMEEIGNRKAVAKCLNNIGECQRNLSHFDEAIQSHEESLRIKKLIDDRKGVSDSLMNIGIIYMIQGNYPSALEYLKESEICCEEIGNKRGLSRCLNNIGVLYKRKNDLPKALEYYKKALLLSEEANDRLSKASFMNNIGVIHKKQGEYAIALEYLHESLEIGTEIGDIRGAANNLLNLGDIHLLNSEYAKAMEYFERCLESMEEVGDQVGVAQVYIKIGEIHLNENSLDTALNYTIQSLEILGELEAVEELKDTYEQLSAIYFKADMHKEAYEYHCRFKELSDRLFNESILESVTRIEFEYEHARKSHELRLERDKRSALHAEEIKQQKTIRNALIFGFIAALVFAVLLYRSYSNKLRANRLLRTQKNRIERKNEQLEVQGEEIKKSLVEKEVLLREVNHRVKNNLQAVVSLLKLQAQHLGNREVVSVLENSCGRIKSMALVYDKLHRDGVVAEINFADYLKSLANSLLQSYASMPNRISLALDLEEIYMGVDVVITCGMIVNELVSNSLKHAFPDDRDGTINIGLRQTGVNELELSVGDDGIGIPSGVDFDDLNSLGLDLVQNLAEYQLDGRVEVRRVAGTLFVISFEKQHHSSETAS